MRKYGGQEGDKIRIRILLFLTRFLGWEELRQISPFASLNGQLRTLCRFPLVRMPPFWIGGGGGSCNSIRKIRATVT
jgi:hypothetical protein